MICRIAKIFVVFLFPLMVFSQDLKLAKPIFRPDIYPDYSDIKNYGTSNDLKYSYFATAVYPGGVGDISSYFIYDNENDRFDYLVNEYAAENFIFGISQAFFSPDSKYLCIIAWDSTSHYNILKWDLNKKQFLKPISLSDFTGGITEVKFLDHDRFISISRTHDINRLSKAVSCHSLSTGNLLWRVDVENEYIISIDNTVDGFVSLNSYYPEGRSYWFKACFWDNSGQLLREVVFPDNSVPTFKSNIISIGSNILVSHLISKFSSYDYGIGCLTKSNLALLFKTSDMKVESILNVSPNKKRIAYLTNFNTIKHYIITKNNLSEEKEFPLDIPVSDYVFKCVYTGDNKIAYLTSSMIKEYDFENKTTRHLSLPYGEVEVLKYFNHNSHKILLGITNNDENRVYNQIIVYDTDKDSICNYLNWNKQRYKIIYDKISISSDDKYIIVLADTNKVNLYNYDDLTLYKSFNTQNNSSITYTKMNQDCSKLAIAATDSTIRIITIKNDVEHLLHVDKIFNYVEMISDTELLLAVKNNSKWYYDIYELGDDIEYEFHSCGISKSRNMFPFTYSPANQYLYYADNENINKVSINDRKNSKILTSSTNEYNSILNSKDDKYLLSNSSNRQIKLLDKATNNIIMDMRDYIPFPDEFTGSLSVADISSDNKKIAIKEVTPALLVFDISHFTSVSEVKTKTDSEMSVYPVPVTNNELTIDINQSSFMCNGIALYNALGQEVQAWDNIQYLPKSLTLTLDMHLSNGVYYLVLSNNKSKQVKQIVINRK